MIQYGSGFSPILVAVPVALSDARPPGPSAMLPKGAALANWPCSTLCRGQHLGPWLFADCRSERSRLPKDSQAIAEMTKVLGCQVLFSRQTSMSCHIYIYRQPHIGKVDPESPLRMCWKAFSISSGGLPLVILPRAPKSATPPFRLHQGDRGGFYGCHGVGDRPKQL